MQETYRICQILKLTKPLKCRACRSPEHKEPFDRVLRAALHLGRHVQDVQADTASVIDVGVVHWCDEAELWWLEWITGRYVNGQSEHALLIDSAFWPLQVKYHIVAAWK